MSQWVHSGPSGAVRGDLGHDASSVKFLDAYSHRIGLDGSSTVNWEVRISGQQNLRSALQGQAHPQSFQCTMNANPAMLKRNQLRKSKDTQKINGFQSCPKFCTFLATRVYEKQAHRFINVMAVTSTSPRWCGLTNCHASTSPVRGVTDFQWC
jgi:hypothetical protein